MSLTFFVSRRWRGVRPLYSKRGLVCRVTQGDGADPDFSEGCGDGAGYLSGPLGRVRVRVTRVGRGHAGLTLQPHTKLTGSRSEQLSPPKSPPQHHHHPPPPTTTITMDRHVQRERVLSSSSPAATPCRASSRRSGASRASSARRTASTTRCRSSSRGLRATSPSRSRATRGGARFSGPSARSIRPGGRRVARTRGPSSTRTARLRARRRRAASPLLFCSGSATRASLP